MPPKNPIPVEPGQLRRGDSPVRPVVRVGAPRGGRFELDAWDHGQWRVPKPRSAANIAEGWPELATEADLYPPEPGVCSAAGRKQLCDGHYSRRIAAGSGLPLAMGITHSPPCSYPTPHGGLP